MVWIISFMHVYACLLLCFISMFACLNLGFAMLGALRGLVLTSFWGHLLVFGCIHPARGLFGCNHLREYIPVMLVCLLHALSPLRAMLCLPCLLYATRLAFFASLHFCMLAYMFVHESLCLLMSSSLIPTIPCRFTPVFDTRDPKSLLENLLDGTCVICTPIQWNYGTLDPNLHLSSYDTPFCLTTCLFVPSCA